MINKIIQPSGSNSEKQDKLIPIDITPTDIDNDEDLEIWPSGLQIVS